MPQRHSKNAGDKHHFTYAEKAAANVGSITQRLGTDSQLPFGYCCLSLQPVVNAVVSPSGHIYEREVIIEYLLSKTKELKRQMQQYLEEQAKIQNAQLETMTSKRIEDLNKFAETQDDVSGILKRKSEEVTSEYNEKRKRLIDDTDRTVKIADLQRVCPWVPQFTPSAKDSDMKEPPKRPSSPITGRPLKSSDLTPIDMIREDGSNASNNNSNSSGAVRFVCSVSRKTITSQKVIALRHSHQVMTEDVAKEFALPTMTCPITSKPFRSSDIIPLVQAQSAYASSGKVEATKYRPSMT